MNENETTALVRAFDRAYINGKFVTPHGTQVVDLVNPTNNTVIGKVTMADEIDTRQAIAAAQPIRSAEIVARLRGIDRGTSVSGLLLLAARPFDWRGTGAFRSAVATVLQCSIDQYPRQECAEAFPFKLCAG